MVNSAILSAAGAFFNWFVRGGGWKSAFYKNVNVPKFISGDIPNALAFGISAWLLTHSLVVSLALTAGIFAGAAPGWGEYITAMKGEHPEESRLWGFGMMSFRGVIWWGCLTDAILFANIWVHIERVGSFILATGVVGSLQGLLYFIPIKWFEKNRSTMIFNHWTTGEMLFGAALWPCLVIIQGML